MKKPRQIKKPCVAVSKQHRDKLWMEKYQRLVNAVTKNIREEDDARQEAWLELLELENESKEEVIKAVGRSVQRIKDRADSYSEHAINPRVIDDEGKEIDFIEEKIANYKIDLLQELIAAREAKEPTAYQKAWLRIKELFIRHALNHEERMTWWLKPKELGFSPGLTYKEIAEIQKKHSNTVGLIVREIQNKLEDFNVTNRLPRKVAK